jgi:hypothetical protein
MGTKYIFHCITLRQRRTYDHCDCPWYLIDLINTMWWPTVTLRTALHWCFGRIRSSLRDCQIWMASMIAPSAAVLYAKAADSENYHPAWKIQTWKYDLAQPAGICRPICIATRPDPIRGSTRVTDPGSTLHQTLKYYNSLTQHLFAEFSKLLGLHNEVAQCGLPKRLRKLADRKPDFLWKLNSPSSCYNIVCG